jgi:hypothetical protein
MLQIRYHPEFKISTNTLLFAGSRDDIDRIRSFFLGWNGEEIDLISHLQAQEKLYLFSVKSLRLQRTTKKTVFTWHGDRGTWFITLANQEQIIGLLDGLLEVNDKGHQYLADGEGPVQIMVSKDEYPLPSSADAKV